MINAYKDYIKDMERKVLVCDDAYKATGIHDFLDTQTELLKVILDLRQSIKEMEDEAVADHHGPESSAT